MRGNEEQMGASLTEKGRRHTGKRLKKVKETFGFG
jgi:hypothetical protein